MATQILEGTWEDIAKDSELLVGKRVRVTVLDQDRVPVRETNQGMKDALGKIRRRQRDMRETSGESGADIVRRGRAGEMFDLES